MSLLITSTDKDNSIKFMCILELLEEYISTTSWQFTPRLQNRIGGVMVSVLASSVVDRGFRPRLGQIKDNKKWHLLYLR